MIKTVLFLFFVGFAHARVFKNPVIEGLDAPDPGAVLYNGTYYVVTTTNNDSPDKFPIHSSKDLQNWELRGYVLNGGNRPVWGTNVEYWAPEIHIIGENEFRVYFTTRETGTKRLCIGAAYATNILGPYHALDRPLVLDPSQDILDSTLINDNGTLNLVWKGSVWMYGRVMDSDGLGFPSNETALLMQNDLPWESYIIEGPWFIQRDGYFYMFYSGNEYCGYKYAVGVARSRKPFGPYEKHGDPILKSDDKLASPGHCSVVKDVDGVSDVMVFHAYKEPDVCDGHPRLMCVGSMAWDDNGWPYMIDL